MVELDVSETDKEFRFLVKDNGKGMTEEELKRAIDPFVTDGIKHPNRKVGLGLPFLIQTAEQSGGGSDIKSEKGKGTTVSAWFDKNNFDIPPTGDVAGMFRTILLFEPTAEPQSGEGSRTVSKAEVIIRRKKMEDDEYEIKKSELIDTIGELNDASSLVLLKQYLESLESDD